MLARSIKDKLRRGDAAIGGWMSTGHVNTAEILASVGFDFVVVETEHTAIDVSEVLRILIAIEGRGCVPLVRLAGIDAIQAKAVLDSGAAGVLVPMVNDRAGAEMAVDAVKYPPAGSRGVGLARAQGYGATFDEYMRRANEETLVVVQIEHRAAVEHIDDILSVPGIDATFIGPYDLSSSLGIPGQLSHPLVVEATERVLNASIAHGVAAGIHLVRPETVVNDLRTSFARGYRFFALGSDILMLGDAARRLHADARTVLQGTV